MPAARTLSISRSGLAATLLVFAVAAGCVRLGFWQLDRLAARRQRNEQVAQRLALPPIELNALPRDSAGWLYRRVTVRGHYDPVRTIILPARYLGGIPGVHVVTPLRLEPGPAVLVNRGWLPAADGINVDPATFREAEPVELEGLLLPFFGPESSLGRRSGDAGARTSRGAHARDGFRRVWFTMDETALRAQFPYPLGRVHILALPAGDRGTGPRRLDPPSLSQGPHLSYAIQWFSFAAIALGGWIALVRKAGRRGH